MIRKEENEKINHIEMIKKIAAKNAKIKALGGNTNAKNNQNGVLDNVAFDDNGKPLKLHKIAADKLPMFVQN